VYMHRPRGVPLGIHIVRGLVNGRNTVGEHRLKDGPHAGVCFVGNIRDAADFQGNIRVGFRHRSATAPPEFHVCSPRCRTVESNPPRGPTAINAGCRNDSRQIIMGKAVLRELKLDLPSCGDRVKVCEVEYQVARCPGHRRCWANGRPIREPAWKNGHAVKLTVQLLKVARDVLMKPIQVPDDVRQVPSVSRMHRILHVIESHHELMEAGLCVPRYSEDKHIIKRQHRADVDLLGVAHVVLVRPSARHIEPLRKENVNPLRGVGREVAAVESQIEPRDSLHSRSVGIQG
jgi:hypothetical protein